MTTPTTRFGLAKIVLGSDNVDVVADFNNNWDSIDAKLGTQVCTSSTRPSSPVQGIEIFETDTTFTRVWKGSAWQTAGNAVATSGARPASPIQGDEFYETDTGFTRSRGASAWNGFLVVATAAALPANPIQGDIAYLSDKDCVVRYTGSAWRMTTIIVCTAATRPTTSIAAGTEIYETDTTRYLIYNGTSWEQKTFSNFVCTSSTHPASPFTGLEIFETDTGLNAVYNGSNYLYGIQQIAPPQVLGSTTASVTFSGIPAGISNLIVKWRARSSLAATVDLVGVQLNGDTASHYLWENVQGINGTSTSQTSNGTAVIMWAGTMPGTSATANYFGSGSFEVNGASDTTNFKTLQGTGAAFVTTTNMYAGTYGGQWDSAAAVTSLTLIPNSGSFTSGSRFILYAAP